MAIIWQKVCKCDRCGHRWIGEAVPYRCAKCKTTKWNEKGIDQTKGEEPVAPVVEVRAGPVAENALVVDKLAALKAQYGIKTGAQLVGGQVADVPRDGDGKRAVELRNFNVSRPGWYDILQRCDQGEILQDKLDRRLWVHQAQQTTARLCRDMAEAERVYGFLEI